MLLFDSKLRFHLINQRLKFILALFLAISVDIPRNALAVDGRCISPFPHVFANLMDRACSTLSCPMVLAKVLTSIPEPHARQSSKTITPP